MRWKKTGLAACLASLGLLAASHDASAQQQQNGNGAGYNWSGFYGGGNLGGSFGGSDFVSGLGRGVPFFEGEFYPGVPNIATPAIIAAYRSNDASIKSFTGGLQGGYNFYAGGLVFGIELDINAINAHKSKTTRAVGDPLYGSVLYTFHNEIDANYVFSARPRVGLPVNGMLLYATGGVAVTTLKHEHNFRGTGGFFAGGPDIVENASTSETVAGWTLGGGVELPVNQGMTIKAEYLFTSFGDVSSSGNKIFPLSATNPQLDFPCGADTGQGGPGGVFAILGTPTPRQCFNHKADLILHTLRVGLNFKF